MFTHMFNEDAVWFSPAGPSDDYRKAWGLGNRKAGRYVAYHDTADKPICG